MKLLLLEDSAADAELLVATLRRAGLIFESTRVDAEPAFRAALAAPPPDVILADLNVPGFGALAALDALKKLGADVPVIVVTGAVSDEEASACIEHGAAAYLLKDRLAGLPGQIDRVIKEAQARAEDRAYRAARREAGREYFVGLETRMERAEGEIVALQRRVDGISDDLYGNAALRSGPQSLYERLEALHTDVTGQLTSMREELKAHDAVIRRVVTAERLAGAAIGAAINLPVLRWARRLLAGLLAIAGGVALGAGLIAMIFSLT